MRRNLKRAAVASVVVPILLFGVIAMGHTQDAGARLFQQVFSRVAHDAIDTLGSQELYEKAARGLIDQLGDPYADLYSPEQLAKFSRQTIGNEYGGVGMQIEDQQGMITVMRVFPNTPARSAGVQAGDRIIAVDSQSTRDWKIEQVSDALLGTPGTKVSATFARVGVSQPIHVEFTRARVHVPAVPYALLLGDSVGYIPLQRFNDAAAAEVQQAMDRLAQQGAHAFVLDLRGNPGGSLDQAIDIADLFVPKGEEIASVRYRSQPEDVFWARRDPLMPGVPTVVLANGYTASASEILAGALQDHDQALVVGTNTFGKGVVQNLFPLDDGWAMKLTTGKWYTPVGRCIQRETLGNGVKGADQDTTGPKPIYHSDSGRTILRRRRYHARPGREAGHAHDAGTKADGRAVAPLAADLHLPLRPGPEFEGLREPRLPGEAGMAGAVLPQPERRRRGRGLGDLCGRVRHGGPLAGAADRQPGVRRFHGVPPRDQGRCPARGRASAAPVRALHARAVRTGRTAPWRAGPVVKRPLSVFLFRCR